MPALERLFGAQAVYGQLQRPGCLRGLAQFVVDQAKRAVGEHVDPVRLGAEPHFARTSRRRKHELALELVLEQPLDDLASLLDLERETASSEPRRRGRSEKMRPLHRPVALW